MTTKITTAQPAKVVRPGTRKIVETVPHDGVVKAKQILPGLTVQAWKSDLGPVGGERVVSSVTPNEDGSLVTIEFSSPHPTTEYKAAYRFYVKGLEGTPIPVAKNVAAFVDYSEV